MSDQASLFPDVPAENPRTTRRLPRERAAYDSTTPRGKRRASSPIIYAEDTILDTTGRQTIKATVQDQMRNFSLISWAVNKVIDYNTSHTFQARSGDTGLDTELERYIERRARSRACDVTGRLNLMQYLRVAYACMIADGDAYSLKLNDGSMQGIEGDRIVLPYASQESRENVTHGVQLDRFGRAKRYAISNRSTYGGYQFNRWVQAENILPLMESRRFDQVRGVSPLASAISAAQDLYEGMEAYAVKAKLVAWAGLVVKRAAGGANPFAPTQSSTTGSDGEERTEYNFKPNGRPFVADLDPGDDISVVESSTPPQEHLNHVGLLTRYILIALDIPYTFLDQTRGSYTIQKDAWTQWELSSRRRREPIRSWLDRWTLWQIGRGIATGELRLSSRLSIEDLVWEWQHTGRPWMDPKELDIDVTAVKMGLESPEAVIKRRGMDPDEIVAASARHYQRMKAAGLPLTAWESK